jgi:ATP-dependent Clp protease adaptor protein ClpS
MTTATADPKIAPKIKPKVEVPEPVRYNVIYINDEVTTQEFVIETLVLIFNYNQEAADEMTMKIHQDGSAVVATLPYEMAEQKGVEVTLLARNNGFPLSVKLEPES